MKKGKNKTKHIFHHQIIFDRLLAKNYYAPVVAPPPCGLIIYELERELTTYVTPRVPFRAIALL